jgi:hypothetical protein
MDSRFIKRNKASLVWCALTLASLAFASADIKANFQQLSNTKQLIREDDANIQQLERQTDLEKEKAKLAEARYKSGCVLLANHQGGFTNLSQGLTVVDPIRKTPLPKGTVICDINGNTGVLQPRDFDRDGKWTVVIADTAFTGNRNLVDRSVERFKNRSSYANPAQY